MDAARAMPVESQWDLLEEYGLNDSFSVVWIDTENVEEVAQRLRADPSSGIVCDLDTAFTLPDYDPQDILVWIGAHSPGWSVAVVLQGVLSFREEEASIGGRRVITHWHMAFSAKLADEGMLYHRDGEFLGPLGSAEEFHDHTHDLVVRDHDGFRELVEALLILAGRVTGRFLDRDWFATSRTLYRVPRDAWSR
ncbi:hypothetical protein GCM10010116_40760 [Microbispora rosea subsp. aerata]|nr:hypothetical protein [Microbispora rosea]GGO20336.1 hypothetical protein GCM10010116_40760 [Microbispora rosea subsp. aerata]GLJ84743.1 hypothetical protein GCM10017588_34710 [Microbispora rosea subsp. aerata]